MGSYFLLHGLLTIGGYPGDGNTATEARRGCWACEMLLVVCEGMERAQGLLRCVWGLIKPDGAIAIADLLREQGAGNFDAIWDRLRITIKHEG